MTDERIEQLFQQVMDETRKDPLRRFAELVAEQTHTNNKAKWYQEGYEAGQHDERKPVKSFSGGVPWYATDAPINEEIERLKAEVKRLQELAEYRLKLLMQMPENKPWVGLTDEEIEKIVDLNTTDDAGYDIFCDGQDVAKAIEAKLKEKNT